MWCFHLTLLLFYLIGLSFCASPDDFLPVYMRGIQWHKVQEHLKRDLRLSEAIVANNYVVELNVNVRGHNGAEKSTFNGTVSIYLNFTKPSDAIELHSRGLIIDKAEIRESLIFSKLPGISKISSNSERETIIIHTNRTIQTGEQFILQITYRGVAIMDEYGLYENWDPKFNKSLDSNGPFVLATNNFPNGARRWFPCFDETYRKATFELQVTHPRALNVYANTAVQRKENVNNRSVLTIFEKSRSISTYQVALSVNHLAVQSIDVKEFGTVRIISSMNSHDNYSSIQERNRYFADISNIRSLLKQHLDQLASTEIGVIPKEKIDIIVLEGTNVYNIHPGLMFIGRYNLWKHDPVHKQYFKTAIDFRNLTQLRTGNMISVKSSNQIWLNQMLSHFLVNETALLEYTFDKFRNFVPDLIFHASLHERPLRDAMTYSTSTKQYLSSRNQLPSLRASQLLQLLIQFCPSAREGLKEYVAAHINGLADIDELIQSVTKSCEDPAIARDFVEDFINQPGKPLLVVRRNAESVTIHQTRYHSSYFLPEMRDNRTRYTLPIFFTIDGEPGMRVLHKSAMSLKIDVNDTSLFLIDHYHDYLYLVFYEDTITPRFTIPYKERMRMVYPLRKSLVAAGLIGYATYERLHEQMAHYADRDVFQPDDIDAVYQQLGSALVARTHFEYKEEGDMNYETCTEWNGSLTSWDGLFNNDTRHWEHPTHTNGVERSLNCMIEWHNSTLYKKFLERNLFGENSAIRPDQFPRLIERLDRFQWRPLHRFFFRNVANFTSHRFDLLADIVLNTAKVQFSVDFQWKYPEESLNFDYVKELRDFVIRHPERAASMSTEIEIRLEREFLREELFTFHKVSSNMQFWNDERALRKKAVAAH